MVRVNIKHPKYSQKSLNFKQKHAWSSVHASFKDVQAAERRGQAHQRQTSSWSLGKALWVKDRGGS